MSDKKLEYDAVQGGKVTLPTHLPTYHFAADALGEIRQLIDEAQQTRSTKLVFQTLPKHMRRRAMSHHPKRLPRKYRVAHISQMSKAGNIVLRSKRPSRKYRRRPKNLMRVYARRQRHHCWLETHIWHAKRFHMINRWGYRLPYASCDKTYRACYQASAKGCLMQDISFYCCVEMKGKLTQLRDGFARLTNPKNLLSIAAKTYTSGRREGSIDLFRDDQYPRGALQRVRFMWRPLDIDDNMRNPQRTLWLWVHPCGIESIIDELAQVFELKTTKQKILPLTNDKMNTDEPEKQAAGQQPLRFWTQTKAIVRYREYANADNTIKLLVLKDGFNRFRLTGENSQKVLAASLRAYDLDDDSADMATHWLAQADVQKQLVHEIQADYCKKAFRLDSPNQLMSNLIIALDVVDPRLQRPDKRSNAARSQREHLGLKEAAHVIQQPPECLPSSVLWQKDLREHLTNELLSTHTYCKLREQHAVVPGQACAFEQKMQPLPLILVQRPGTQTDANGLLGYGCGWDIILPEAYSLILWMTLVMWGARPGGLREFEMVAREASSEQHLPDTLPGVQQTAIVGVERAERYFRLPPNKRCNYRKFAVASPFTPPFDQLIRDWLPATAFTIANRRFYVLRDLDVLLGIINCLEDHSLPVPNEQQIPADCLIQINLRLQSRGNIQENALICVPTLDDFKCRKRQLLKQDLSPVYVEPKLPDLNDKQRRELRFNHKRLLKRLRGRRVREKRKLQETSVRRVYIRAANTSQLVSEHQSQMRRLWLPDDPAETSDSVRRQCSREVIGYVTSANFNHTRGTVCAVGYVTPGGLRRLVEANGLQRGTSCLVRNADSRDYRFAILRINLAVTNPPI